MDWAKTTHPPVPIGASVNESANTINLINYVTNQHKPLSRFCADEVY